MNYLYDTIISAVNPAYTKIDFNIGNSLVKPE